MKKYLSFFLLAFLFLGNVFAQQNDFKTQGISRPELQKRQGAILQPQSKTLRNTDFTFDDIKFWVGEGENQAALVIDWYYTGETAMVWGYRWNGEASGLDMIKAIANADPNFLLLTQLTNLGNTIAGIGYGYPRSKIELTYDLEGAKTDSRISFKFDEPNIFLGQTHCPIDPASEISAAIQTGISTGIIDHPFNYANYGYASYDYDHWKSSNSDVKWRSAWYDGYWSYLVRDDISDDYSYSGLGATLRVLSDGSWDAWGFQDGWDSWEGVNPREPYIAALPPEVNVTGVSLKKDNADLAVNETLQLVAVITPENATNKNIIWKSDNESVASVDGNGLVTAITPGSANITVTAEEGNFSASCFVIVTNPLISVTGISLNINSSELEVNKTLQLAVTITPENATNKNIIWKSNNESVALVDANGLVTARTTGSANITATTEDGGFSATCSVTVTNSVIAITGISLNIISSDLEVNETLQLTATIIPENATNKNIIWESNNESVASVDGNGLVTAITPGSTNIIVTAEDGDFTAYCSLSVKVNTTGITDINTTHSIYPTVTDDIINISMEQAVLVQVIDITGRVLYSFIPKELKTSISMRKYTNGIYFIKTGNRTTKIIKK